MKNLEEYLEVHYDIVEFISDHLMTTWTDSSVIKQRYEAHGRGAMYELSKEWTDIFMRNYEDTEWGEDMEYYDTIGEFCWAKNKEV